MALAGTRIGAPGARSTSNTSSDMPGSSSNGGRPGGGSSGGAGRSRKTGKARKPGLFEIKVVTPPPRSLGIYALPPMTHNGEEIEIEGQGYVVTRLELTFKLVKGRYVRDHSRLEVQPTGRYFLNMMLDNLIHGTYVGPADCGQQD
ncbi:hypothetical protein OEZ86_000469 [Tetradesmus obliquus]|nr:hypothetical protein OEZ86_000469 [Tetradesmus obliquus]